MLALERAKGQQWATAKANIVFGSSRSTGFQSSSSSLFFFAAPDSPDGVHPNRKKEAAFLVPRHFISLYYAPASRKIVHY